MTRVPTSPPPTGPLLGEFAVLGVLFGAPAHGYAIARQLAPDGAVGRIWTVGRALTYRSLTQLQRRGWVEETHDDTDRAAGPRRVTWVATREGRERFRAWLAEPVEHQRDLRSEFLLKLTFGTRYGISTKSLIAEQGDLLARAVEGLERLHARDPDDLVAAWRLEQTVAAQRFCAGLRAAASSPDSA